MISKMAIAERAEKSSAQTRLDSWKSIANYLSRSSRTVQRWHSEFGMPVHHLGGDTGSIFAYSDELDSWLRSRGQTFANRPAEPSRPVLLYKPPPPHEAAQQRETFDSSHYPHSRSARSSEMVGRAFKLWQTLSPSNVNGIARLFRQAIDLDVDNAEAFAGLSHTLIVEGLQGNLRTAVAYSSAAAAGQRALEIDSELLEGKCAEAWLMMLSERKWQSARQGFDEVLSGQSPPTTRALVGRALLHVAEGSPTDASNLLMEASQRSPLSVPSQSLRCWSEYLAGEYGRALAIVSDARAAGNGGRVLDAVEALASIQFKDPTLSIEYIEILAAPSPDSLVLQGTLGYAYAMAGKIEEAHKILDALTELHLQNMSDVAYPISLVLIGLGEGKNALRWLEQSYREGSLWSLGFQSDPILAALRNNPSYQDLMDNIDYPVST